MTAFETGTTHITDAARRALQGAGLEPAALLARHRSCDWGQVSDAQRIRNAWALEQGDLIRSIYPLPDGTRILVSTADTRDATWVMLRTEFGPREVDLLPGYACWARTYEKGMNPLIELEEPHVAPILEALQPSLVLDVGTGTGRYARRLAQRGTQVLATDLCPEMLAVAQRHAIEDRLDLGLHLCALDALPIRSDSIPLVVCALVLCHVADLRRAFAELARPTAPGGHVLITDFHPEAVASGMRSGVAQADGWCALPNPHRTRDGYLTALQASGLVPVQIIDLRVGDIPEEKKRFFGTWVQEDADRLFCLIVLARKPDAAPPPAAVSRAKQLAELP